MENERVVLGDISNASCDDISSGLPWRGTGQFYCIHCINCSTHNFGYLW